jgi:cation/acetate symporter
LINFVVAFTVLKFTADAPDEIQQLVEDIRYPQGSGQAQLH